MLFEVGVEEGVCMHMCVCTCMFVHVCACICTSIFGKVHDKWQTPVISQEQQLARGQGYMFVSKFVDFLNLELYEYITCYPNKLRLKRTKTKSKNKSP